MSEYTVKIPFTGTIEMTVEAKSKKQAIEIAQENARLNNVVEYNLDDKGIEVYKED